MRVSKTEKKDSKNGGSYGLCTDVHACKTPVLDVYLCLSVLYDSTKYWCQVSSSY